MLAAILARVGKGSKGDKGLGRKGVDKSKWYID